jgi:hypothetical protein
MLETSLQMFARLRTGKGRDRYPEITVRRCRNQVRSTRLRAAASARQAKFEIHPPEAGKNSKPRSAKGLNKFKREIANLLNEISRNSTWVAQTIVHRTSLFSFFP